MQFSIVLHKAMMPKPDLRIRVQGSEVAVSSIHQMNTRFERKREMEEQKLKQKRKRNEREEGSGFRVVV